MAILPSCTTITGIPSLSLVLDDNLKNPYSNEYSMMYSSDGQTREEELKRTKPVY